MDEVTKAELERLHDEEKRQNRRIELLEQNMVTLQDLAMSVQKLAINMEGMLEEQKSQGDRLDKLEEEPARAWKDAKKTIITVIISTIAGGMATGLIFMLSQTVG